MLPPIPPLSGLHPLVIHFPIALLLIVPASLIASLLFFKHHRTLSLVTLALIFVGTASAYAAIFTGEASEEKVDIPETATPVLMKHEELAHLTRNVFTGLAIAYLLVSVGPLIIKKPLAKPVTIVVNLIFLGLYSGGTLLVANTAHQGGRLVHEFGIHTMEPATTQPAVSVEHSDHDHDG